MNRPWAPLVVLLASATASVLACSRSSLQPARPDGSTAGPVSDALADGQVPADAAPSDPAPRSTCGNGRLDPGEQCDDGNTLDGDDCTKDCRIDCTTCAGMCPGCSPLRSRRSCGDGRVTSDEVCDDGNMVSGDGCSGDCKTIEAGFRCRVPGKICIPICGDGLLVGWESLLDAEPSCDPNDQRLCGDGQVTGYEECDCGDGTMMFPVGCAGPNEDSYGRCTTKCTWGPFCGDGMVNDPEECDLGSKNGTLGRDGCTAGCTTPHYCGDGILDTDLDEDCDLGDLNGVPIDREGKPSNGPDASVRCSAYCRLRITTI
jgi:cysteine-rich repeat protein